MKQKTNKQKMVVAWFAIVFIVATIFYLTLGGTNPLNKVNEETTGETSGGGISGGGTSGSQTSGGGSSGGSSETSSSTNLDFDIGVTRAFKVTKNNIFLVFVSIALLGAIFIYREDIKKKLKKVM